MYCTGRNPSFGISIHALREEGDDGSVRITQTTKVFQSTPSVRRATEAPEAPAEDKIISIHALREEGDRDLFAAFYDPENFNPRSP